MQTKQHNVAYIDGANLYSAIQDLDWELDYTRFRIWLKDKYQVDTAYLFLGLVPKYKNLYTALQEAGFTLVFKETIHDDKGNIKGNCDADLVLMATRNVFEKDFDKAILISSDGDYASLVSFLLEKQAFHTVLSPSKKCSVLLKRTNAKITYLEDVQSKIKKYP